MALFFHSIERRFFAGVCEVFWCCLALGSVLYGHSLASIAVALDSPVAVEKKPSQDQEAAASDPPDPTFDEIRALLQRFCYECHSSDQMAGDLDLEQFQTQADVQRQPQVWVGVLEQLNLGEMPPADHPQLSVAQKQTLSGWTQSTLDRIALAQAGDPGPVALRRLSNMEFTYSVQDWTGLATLEPTREFPADGAAGEGFTNASAALVMSPTLVSKYLDAAKSVAEHAVLVPQGIQFSPSTTTPDWTKRQLDLIRDFYHRFSSSDGATAVDLQGVRFDTNSGGRLDIQAYLRVLLLHRESLQADQISVEALARQSRLNSKYLGLLWQHFNDPQPSLLLAHVWQAFNATDPHDQQQVQMFLELVTAWQQSLWRFESVGQIGKTGGPTAWQTPLDPLTFRHSMELALEANQDNGDCVVYLEVSDSGDGNAFDFAIWHQPQIVTADGTKILLNEIQESGDGSASDQTSETHSSGNRGVYGLPAGDFGRHPHDPKRVVDHQDICVQAPSLLEIRLPAALVAGGKFVVEGGLAPSDFPEEAASVQMQVLLQKPATGSGLQSTAADTEIVGGQWFENLRRTRFSAPIVVRPDSAAHTRWKQAFDEFRSLVPAALCYVQIVPVDEAVTLTLYHREDHHLQRLMLSDLQRQQLDQLWQDLRFVNRIPSKQFEAFEQLYQYATQDADPSAFEPLREPMRQAAVAFEQEVVQAEPAQLQAAIDLAHTAWRRSLPAHEISELEALYHSMRQQSVDHPAAIRMLLVRIMVSPHFLYRGESPAPGTMASTVNPAQLATRLSYFLWASIPDTELRTLADNQSLHQNEILVQQTQRLLRDPKIRRLATEFGCQWLQVRDLESLDEKSERHFPTFVGLRADMQEETTRFFMDLFQNDRSVLSLLDADHTFLNARLAEHYGIAFPPEIEREFDLGDDRDAFPGPWPEPSTEPMTPVSSDDDWRPVTGLSALGRGGILSLASTLARHSGASRTSPILRGNWINEVVLGQSLPKPPKNIPALPEETPPGLSERELIERHSSDPACAKCHQRIDPFGFALEGFDAIGRQRTQDAAGMPIDTKTTLPDGTSIDGIGDLRNYLLQQRRDDFVRQFCRKLLGYALGRSVQLSDQPLIDSMQEQLAAHDYRVSVAIQQIVLSPQFQQIRGLDHASVHSP